MDLISTEASGDVIDYYHEPVVTSADPNERKLARRLRIERRLENLRRQNMGEGEEIEEKTVEKTLLQQQLEKTEDILDKLMLEGIETITNVRVANDSREVDRREEEGIGRENIIEKLEEEANLATEKFNEISEKWGRILRYNDPLHINEEMNAQKDKCEELIKQKDAVIAMLREDIRQAERKFTNDQRKQNDDINILTQRIEKQVMAMRRAYRRELQFIEDVIMEERKMLIETNDKKWDELYKKRENEEKSQCEKKFEQHEEFVQEMSKLRIEHQEKFREAKIQLECELEELQRELERIKTMAMMNGEKLDYNYQILRKREDENLIINSQQKRKINKLQDVIQGLRKQIAEYEDETKAEMERLTADVKKLQRFVVQNENKAESLSKINDLKYKQVWDLNVENANECLNRIFTVDRILYEQQLGLEWKKPESVILTKSDLPSYRFATETLHFVRACPSRKSTFSSASKASIPSTTKPKSETSYRNLLRHILVQISGKAGFLIEERLNAVLEPYIEEDRTLVKMDNVFTALGIKQKTEIDQLVQYFLPYAKCPICVNALLKVDPDADVLEINDQNDNEDNVESSSSSENIFTNIMDTVNQPEHIIEGVVHVIVNKDEVSEATSSAVSDHSSSECMPPASVSIQDDSEMSKIMSKKSMYASRFTCRSNHPLVVNPVFVIRALREFITNFYVDTSGVQSLASKLSRKHTNVSRLMCDDDVKMFWERYRNTFSDAKERLWDGLFVGLQKYYDILRDRKKLNDEVVTLRRQNAELKHLLSAYKGGTANKPPCALQREIPIVTIFTSDKHGHK